MWTYNKVNNYYYCFLYKCKLVVQPFQDSYRVNFSTISGSSVYIKTFIHADNIEDAQHMAMKIVRNSAIENVCFWNNILEEVENNLGL